jgi:hypothetical protein
MSETKAAGATDLTTLDALLRRHAAARPDAPALVEMAPGDPARRLTYGEVDAAAARFAARLHELSLTPGAAIALQADNRLESIVALLGILRGGFVAAPIPLLWRHADAAAALAMIEARALIAAAGDPADGFAGVALRTAAETFSVRYVLGFGDDVPDGMVPLGSLRSEEPPAPLPVSRGNATTALITFEAGPEGHVPCPRADAALLVGGSALVLEAGLAPRATILATMLPSSFAVLATTLVPWLLTGGTLALHPPFDAETFAALCAETKPDAVIVPGPLATPLADAGLLASVPAAIALWRAPELREVGSIWGASARLIDVLAFGEAGLVAARRGPDGTPAALRAGRVTAPTGDADGMTVATLSRTPAGTLAFGGAMTGHDAPVDTGFPCRLAEDGTLTLSGPPPGLVGIGGYRFAIESLRETVRRVAPEGVLAALPDTLAGQKLAGSGADPDAIRRALAEQGTSRLVSAAFRARSAG